MLPFSLGLLDLNETHLIPSFCSSSYQNLNEMADADMQSLIIASNNLKNFQIIKTLEVDFIYFVRHYSPWLSFSDLNSRWAGFPSKTYCIQQLHDGNVK